MTRFLLTLFSVFFASFLAAQEGPNQFDFQFNFLTKSGFMPYANGHTVSSNKLYFAPNIGYARTLLWFNHITVKAGLRVGFNSARFIHAKPLASGETRRITYLSEQLIGSVPLTINIPFDKNLKRLKSFTGIEFGPEVYFLLAQKWSAEQILYEDPFVPDQFMGTGFYFETYYVSKMFRHKIRYAGFFKFNHGFYKSEEMPWGMGLKMAFTWDD